jgi:hypothetical protein
MFGKKDKLTTQEIDRALDMIRSKYDHLITAFMAPLSLKNDFEERYSQALRMRMGMELFIRGEMEMIEELIQEEEEAREQEEQAKLNRLKNGPKRSFADKVIEDLEKQIEGYPSRRVHPDAALEIIKLYGALQQFERDFWGAVENFLLRIFPSERNGLLAQLDQNLWNMTYSRAKQDNREIPVALERYVMMLDSNDYHYDLLGETQNCIKQGAFWLHDVRDAIRKAGELGFEEERVNLAEEELSRMIKDFRLKDIKKP